MSSRWDYFTYWNAVCTAIGYVILALVRLSKTLPKQGVLQIMIHVFLVKMKTALPSRLFDTILFIISAHKNRSIETRQAMAYLCAICNTRWWKLLVTA